MDINPTTPAYYADFGALETLKRSASNRDPAAVREVARQFESLFTAMVLKSMRAPKLGPDLVDSTATDTYQDMYDQQLAVQMSQGKGLGLADLLVQQLTRAKAGVAGSSAPIGAPVGAPAGAPIPIPAAGSAAAPQPNVTDAQRAKFIQRIQPLAEAASQRLGVAADAIVAQAALETGWGQHVPATAAGTSSFNLFGIKSSGSWRGASTTSQTVEFQQDTPTVMPASFRVYESPDASVRDYTALIGGSPRYAAALGSGADVGAYANALQRGGYATDPDYATKLVATAQSIQRLRATGALKSGDGMPIALGEIST